MSMAAAACGRIVTVPKTGANGGLVPAGNMFIRYRVLGTLDFTGLRYLIVFNTSGNGLTPLPAQSTQSYVNYSFILAFGGTQVSGAAYAVYQIVNSGSGGYTAVLLPQAPQFITNFNQNSSGSSNEFTFTFNRLLLTPLANVSPSPSPTATPNAIPTLASGVSSLWAINVFSADANNNPIDAVGNLGIQDVTFSSFVIDTLSPFDYVVNKPNPLPYQVSNTNAQIVSVEIINQP
jgi:hypothetical protein